MSVLPNQTNATLGDAFFWRIDASTITAKSFISDRVLTNTLSTGSLVVGAISTTGTITVAGDVIATNLTATDTVNSYFNNSQYATVDQILTVPGVANIAELSGTDAVFSRGLQAKEGIISTITTTRISLDGNNLDTAGGGIGAVLLLNGYPVATTSTSISSLVNWSIYPAISTLRMAGNQLVDASLIQSSNINTDNITSYDINAINQIVFGTNLYGPTGNLNRVNANSISTALLLATSTATNYISTGSIDVTTISASNIYASNATQTGNLTVMSNATINSNLFIPRSPDPFYGGAIIQGNHSPGFAITNYIDAAATRVYGDVSFSNGLYNFYNNAIEANANIDLHGGTMCNTGRIDTDGAKDLSIASGSNLLINSDKDTTFNSKRNFNITASNGIEQKATVALTTIDNGIGVGANSSYRVNAKNGNRGYIELKADPGYAGIQGELHLIANGGSAAGYQTGGFVDIQANAGTNVLGVLSYSRVGILADSITSYAGGYAPVTGTKGYNFINGSVGVNITAAAVSVVPQLAAGSVYLYGGNPGDAGNSGGVKIQNGLSADKIQPYPDILQRTDPEYDLIIKGNNEGLKVQLSNIRYMYSDGGIATGFNDITGTNISATASLFGSNIGGSNLTILAANISSINTNSLSTLQINAQSLIGVSTIDGYTVSQLISSVTPPQFYSTVSTFLQLFTSSLVANNIYSPQASFSSLTGVSTIDGYTIAQLVSSTTPVVFFSTVSSFQQLYTSSLVASNISTHTINADTYLLGGAALSPQQSSFQQLYTSSLQANQISSGNITVSTVNGLNPSQLGTSSFQTLYASTATFLQTYTSSGTINNASNITLSVSSINGYNTNDFLALTNVSSISTFQQLYTSSLQASVISTASLTAAAVSTVKLETSSINGYNINQLINTPQLSTFSQLFTSSLAASSIYTQQAVISTITGVSTINGYTIAEFVSSVSPPPPQISSFLQLYTSSLVANTIGVNTIGTSSNDLTLNAVALNLHSGGPLTLTADSCNVTINAPNLIELVQYNTINQSGNWSATAESNVSLNASNALSIYTTDTPPVVGSNGLFILGQGQTTLAGQLNTTVSAVNTLNLNGGTVLVNGAPIYTGGIVSTFSNLYVKNIFNNPAVSSDVDITAAATLLENAGNIIRNANYTISDSAVDGYTLNAGPALATTISADRDIALSAVSSVLVQGVSTIELVSPTLLWNGAPIGGGGWVGTAASDLNMNGYSISSVQALNINSGSQVRMGTPLAYVRAGYTSGTATSSINMYAKAGIIASADNSISFTDTKQLTLAGSNVDIAANNTLELYTANQGLSIYSVNGGVSTFAPNVSIVGSNSVGVSGSNINLLALTNINIAAPVVALSNVSSINGVAYTGGGSTWVGTATSDLDMNGYNIGTTAGSNLTIASASQSLEFNQGSSVTTLSNGPGYIDIRAPSGAINLLASNTVYAGGAQYNTSNIGNSLGTFVPFRGYYEPPTGSGQRIELQIEGHAADAGARFLLTYGCDIASGTSYLIGSWPGYILTPLTCYGQTVTLDATESVYLTAGSGNITQTATAAINLVAGGDINIQGAHIALSNLSSINGVAYTGGGSTWVGTAASDLNMNGYNIGTASGSNLSITGSSNLTLATGLQSLVFNQGSLVATLSNGVGSVDIIAPTTNITSSNINLLATGDIALTTSNTKYITIAQLGTGPQSRFELPPNGDFYGYARSNFDLAASNNFYAAASNAINLAAPTTNISSTTINLNGSITTFGASGGDIQQINTAFWANGGTAQGYGGSLYLGASNSVYFQVPVAFQNTGTTPIYMNSNNIEQIRTLYFQTTGNIDAYQSAGVNYLNINAPNTTGSGTGQLRFFGQKGNLIFDDNVTLGGNGSNYVGVYNQYGYVQIASDQNIYIGGGGGSIGGVSAINLNSLTLTRHNGSYAGGLISQITNQAASASPPGSRFGTVFIEAPNAAATGESGVQISLETSNYGGAIFGGIKQGVGSFISLATNNNAGSQTERMRINGVNGYVGINTTTPYYQLDVIGGARVSGDLYANNGLYRNLSATAVDQPVIQYGEDAGSGTSGNITITIPVAYTSATSYVAFASVMDGTACKISVTRDSASQITIYWDAAGSGTLPIAWNTMGI